VPSPTPVPTKNLATKGIIRGRPRVYACDWTANGPRSGPSQIGFTLIILGLILLLIGILASIPILTTIGIVLLVVGLVLVLIGRTGNAIGGRKHFF